jgi:hypothetical protein
LDLEISASNLSFFAERRILTANVFPLFPFELSPLNPPHVSHLTPHASRLFPHRAFSQEPLDILTGYDKKSLTAQVLHLYFHKILKRVMVQAHITITINR